MREITILFIVCNEIIGAYHLVNSYLKCMLYSDPRKAVYNTMREITIPVRIRNRFIFAGLEQVLSHTEKSQEFNLIFNSFLYTRNVVYNTMR